MHVPPIIAAFTAKILPVITAFLPESLTIRIGLALELLLPCLLLLRLELLLLRLALAEFARLELALLCLTLFELPLRSLRRRSRCWLRLRCLTIATVETAATIPAAIPTAAVTTTVPPLELCLLHLGCSLWSCLWYLWGLSLPRFASCLLRRTAIEILTRVDCGLNATIANIGLFLSKGSTGQKCRRGHQRSQYGKTHF